MENNQQSADSLIQNSYFSRWTLNRYKLDALLTKTMPDSVQQLALKLHYQQGWDFNSLY